MNSSICFIIPAYNAEKVIGRCITSIINLEYSKYKILVVNDGSTDSTLKVISDIHSDRIEVITQDNSGVSAARNTGIKNANADYIMFIDADDYIITEEVDKALNNIESGKDFYMFSYEHEENGYTRKVDTPLLTGLYDGEKSRMIAERLVDVKYSNNYNSKYFGAKVYQYLISLSFIRVKNLEFPVGVPFAEDCVFCYKMFGEAQNFEVLNYKSCHYIVYGESASHKYRPNFWKEIKTFYTKICEINNGELKNKKEFFFYYANDVVSRAVHHSEMIGNSEVIKAVTDVINSEEIKDFKLINASEFTAKEKLLLYFYSRKNVYGLVLIFKLSKFIRKIK